MPAHRPLLSAAVAVLAVAQWAASAAAQVADSSVVIIGGGLEDAQIYDEILRLAGGPEKARVAILTTASDPRKAEANGRFYEETFRDRGAQAARWMPIDADHPERAEDRAIARDIAGYNVFFLGGGDQERYADVLLRRDGSDTRVLAAMRNTFENRGAVIAGTSAGAAALVESTMIVGGESYEALAQRDGVRDRVRGGLRFFRWGLIDTHFSERGRQGRLIRLAARRGVPLAIGVDEDTGLVFRNVFAATPRFHVVGTGGVSIFDLTRSRVRGGKVWGIDNVRAHYLTRGDGYDPIGRRALIGDGKKPDRRRGRPRVADLNDIFSTPGKTGRKNSRAFVRASMEAFSSTGKTVEGRPAEDPSWRIRLRRGRGAALYRGGDLRSYRNLRVDIKRVRGR